jgi:hypothetical protein
MRWQIPRALDLGVTVTDVTPQAHEIHDLIRAGEQQAAGSVLPAEGRIPARPDRQGHRCQPALTLTRY